MDGVVENCGAGGVGRAAGEVVFVVSFDVGNWERVREVETCSEGSPYGWCGAEEELEFCVDLAL